MSKDMFSQLKKLRTEPRAGYASEERRAEGRERLMSAIASSQDVKATWAPVAAFEFMRFSFSDLLAKPITAFASFAILIFGSLTTVSAASQSLPGDTLYSVKLVSERAQLSLARSDKKAVLHTDFAGRRLQEIVELTSVQEPDQNLVATTVNAFKREVASATQEIQNLQLNSSDALLAQVSVVSERFSALNDSVEDSTIAQTQELSNDIKKTTASAGEQVVETVVGTHEVEPQPASANELRELFRKRMNKIIQRRTFSLGRIEVIERSAMFAEVSSRRDVAALRQRVEAAGEQLASASRFVASGGYRAAFDDLRTAEDLLAGIESDISAIEFKLIEVQSDAPTIDLPMSDIDAITEVDGGILEKLNESPSSLN